MTLPVCNIVIAGAGFFGLTLAHQAATRLGLKVLVVERRSHIGGNATQRHGPCHRRIETHEYGSHLFHCNNEEIWNYLNGFTPFTTYRHHVQTVYQRQRSIRCRSISERSAVLVASVIANGGPCVCGDATCRNLQVEKPLTLKKRLHRADRAPAV